MDRRLELHELLCELAESRNVYFQPPSDVRMNYRAIVYNRKGIDNTYANNSVYKQDVPYELTVIDHDPDSDLVKKVSRLPRCRHDRHYTADGLNHDVFTLYY
jgi:hypothetical protein